VIAGNRCYGPAMAAFPCPYCGHALVSDDDDADANAKLERCPSCDGNLLIAYRYRLVAAHGKISGGSLYLASDDGFNQKFAVLFADDQDPAAVERFVEGARLFADLGGRGLVKIYEIGTLGDRRAYVVMDWLDGGTLDVVVERRGALEQALLLELVGDLLTGLSKAHRSMPAIVHGHIHPGKIGFRNGSGNHDEVVLFGFEWATQASQLADSFIREDQSVGRMPASDLRQLGIVFHYAATGDWIGDDNVERQRERVRASVPGPLGRLIDRLLGAGVDGYKTAVEAAIDFEQLMRGGVDRWQGPATAQVDRSAERMGTAWTDNDGDDDDDVEEIEDDEVVAVTKATPARRVRAAPPETSAILANAQPNWSAWAAQRQAEALAQAQGEVKPPPNPARAIGIVIGVIVVFSTCVAAILEDANDSPPPPPQFRGVQKPPIPSRSVEPIPAPADDPWREPPPPEPEPSPEPVAPLPGMFHYEGKTTGPVDFAGVALGESCDVWIEPNDGSLNCRWYIDCGKPKRRIYGGGSAGYSTCELDDEGRPILAADEQDDAPDGAFFASLGTDHAMVLVTDRWTLPPVNVIITITGGGQTNKSVPDVSLAPRFVREDIDRRIRLGDYPTTEPGVVGDW
jgi:hypothetical protein